MMAFSFLMCSIMPDMVKDADYYGLHQQQPSYPFSTNQKNSKPCSSSAIIQDKNRSGNSGTGGNFDLMKEMDQLFSEERW